MLRALYEKHVLPSFKKARKVGKELPDLLTLFLLIPSVYFTLSHVKKFCVN